MFLARRLTDKNKQALHQQTINLLAFSQALLFVVWDFDPLEKRQILELMCVFLGLQEQNPLLNPFGCLGIISNPYLHKQYPPHLWSAGVYKTDALPLYQ